MKRAGGIASNRGWLWRNTSEAAARYTTLYARAGLSIIATAIGCAVQGLTGAPVTVEVDVANGLPVSTGVNIGAGDSEGSDVR